MIDLDNIEIIKDSLSSIVPLLRELVNNSNPEPYTVENLSWTKFNVAISIIAAIIGALGVYYGYKGYYFSKQTAKNVSRLPQSTQMRICLSYIMDLSANFVRAIDLKVFCNNEEKSPSDSYISSFALPDFSEIFKPEIFYENEKAFISLNYLKARMERYKHQLDIFEKHCSENNVTDIDIEGLISKISKVLRSVFIFMHAAYGDNNILPLLYEKMTKSTLQRKDLDLINNKAIPIKNIYSELISHFDYSNLSWPDYILPKKLKNKIAVYIDNEPKNDSILLFFFNAIIEYQYIHETNIQSASNK